MTENTLNTQWKNYTEFCALKKRAEGLGFKVEVCEVSGYGDSRDMLQITGNAKSEVSSIEEAHAFLSGWKAAKVHSGEMSYNPRTEPPGKPAADRKEG